MTSTPIGTVTTAWEPSREPLRTTLIRTVGLAVVGGAVLSHWWGGIARWPLASLVLLWPTLGGHYVELWFLNWLRPRLPMRRDVHAAARVATWFAGGVLLFAAMRWTVALLTGAPPVRSMPWWVGGLAFIAIELVAQLGLRLRGRPSFYDGRG